MARHCGSIDKQIICDDVNLMKTDLHIMFILFQMALEVGEVRSNGVKTNIYLEDYAISQTVKNIRL